MKKFILSLFLVMCIGLLPQDLFAGGIHEFLLSDHPSMNEVGHSSNKKEAMDIVAENFGPIPTGALIVQVGFYDVMVETSTFGNSSACDAAFNYDNGAFQWNPFAYLSSNDSTVNCTSNGPFTVHRPLTTSEIWNNSATNSAGDYFQVELYEDPNTNTDAQDARYEDSSYPDIPGLAYGYIKWEDADDPTVPEPTTWASVVIGSLCLGHLLRRKRK